MTSRVGPSSLNRQSSAGSPRGLGVAIALALLALATILAPSALFPSSAQAAIGIDTWWGNDNNQSHGAGGLFSKQIRGVAVVEGAVGGANSGDVYVADSGNHRIQRFTAGGTFLAAWGKDVDATTVETGYELCETAANCQAGETGGLGGELSGPAGLAVDQESGEVYVVDTGNRRVQVFSATGTFLRAFGKDVVQASQAGDSPAASAQQTLTVTATGGSYTLSFGTQESDPLPFNADAAEVQTALTELPAIGAGNVEVSGASSPFTIDFKGDHADNPEPLIVAAPAPGDPLTGGSADVAETQAGSNGFEICVSAPACQTGASGEGAGAFSFASVGTSGFGSSLTVVPADAPNAANVLIADSGNRRIQEFSPNGQFRRAFAWDVVAAGPSDSAAGEFEVCSAVTFDSCKAGSSGSGDGQFASGMPTRVTEDSNGRIYVVEPTGNFRVQRLILLGDVPTPDGEFAASTLHGSVNDPFSAKDNTSEIAVDDAGTVYAVKAFPIGMGMPPVEVEGALPSQWAQRVLQLDPLSGAVTRTFGLNPGSVSVGVNNSRFEGIISLAALDGGSRLYATTTSDSWGAKPRVWRFGELTGIGATEVRAEEVTATTATLEASLNPALIDAAFRPPSAYRFEYSEDEGASWKVAPTADVLIGNGSAGGGAPNCPTVQAATCQVGREVAGLTPGATYRLRVAIYPLFNKGTPTLVEGAEFTTVAEPPVVRTGAAVWSSPAPTKPSLRLSGAINPGGERTTYQFEYVDAAAYQADIAAGGDGFGKALRTPSSPGDAGRGLLDVSVSATIAGLDPTRDYHHRLIALNSIGPAVGAAQSVAPPGEADRFFEWVSAGESYGSGVDIKVGSVNGAGDRAMFVTQAFGDPQSVPGVYNPYLAVREAGSWVQAPLPLGPERVFADLAPLISADLGSQLWPQSTTGEQLRSEGQLVLTRIDGGEVAASPQLVPIMTRRTGKYQLRGASGDLSKAVFQFGPGNVTLLPGESLLSSDNRSNLYAVEGAGGPSPSLAIVNREDGAGGAILGGACGATMPNVPHAISDDGDAIYFYAHPNAPPASQECKTPGSRRLYKRLNGAQTVEVSAPQCDPACGGPDGDDVHLGASADGEVVFFSTVRRLVDADTDSTADIYLYDETPPTGQPKLVQVSAGEAVAPQHPDPGAGAEALGILDNAANGQRIYFVARGRLTEAATSGLNNLYVYERSAAHPVGRVAFVGLLTAGIGSGDQREWEGGIENAKMATALPVADGWGDGHMLAFVTATKLLPAEDGDFAKDLYTYDDTAAPGAALRCLSCMGDGAFDVRVKGRFIRSTQPDYASQARVASEDLQTFAFATEESLLGTDENLTWDAYAWESGELTHVSKGTGGAGIGRGYQQTAVSADGRGIFFITGTSLVGSDSNNAQDLYVARIGGGSPDSPRAEGCTGEACRAPAPGPAPASGPLGSATFSGPGNLKAGNAKPRRCRKGAVRRKGRCVSRATVIRRACAKRSGKAKRRCVQRQSRRLNSQQAKRKRANRNRRAAR